MASISLEASLRTCKVDTGWASKVESDRFLNPNNMVCPLWNGVDTAGRPVAPDSFYTKRAGCNNATDRVVVENNVSRPQYMEYINLNANGVAGHIYGNTNGYQQTGARNHMLNNVESQTGQFGLQTQFGQNVLQNCNSNCDARGSCRWEGAYPSAMAQEAQQSRMGQHMNQGMQAHEMRQAGGM
tara:strand:- start:59 stop:610 length:552 start_codon:yes stop_codon:yes gene_type:complete